MAAKTFFFHHQGEGSREWLINFGTFFVGARRDGARAVGRAEPGGPPSPPSRGGRARARGRARSMRRALSCVARVDARAPRRADLFLGGAALRDAWVMCWH